MEISLKQLYQNIKFKITNEKRMKTFVNKKKKLGLINFVETTDCT